MIANITEKTLTATIIGQSSKDLKDDTKCTVKLKIETDGSILNHSVDSLFEAFYKELSENEDAEVGQKVTDEDFIWEFRDEYGNIIFEELGSVGGKLKIIFSRKNPPQIFMKLNFLGSDLSPEADWSVMDQANRSKAPVKLTSYVP